MNVIDFLKSKVILFIIQILILSLFLFYSGYQFGINFDNDVTHSQEKIIQYVANYVLFDNLTSLLFIYTIWLVVSLIPILLYNNHKKAYSMNLTTFFFPNFFTFAFLKNYSEDYFNSNFVHHFLHSLMLGILIIIVSVFFSLILEKIISVNTEERLENLDLIAHQIKSTCPNCGKEFNSKPIYCYNCNTKIIEKPENNVKIK